MADIFTDLPITIEDIFLLGVTEAGAPLAEVEEAAHSRSPHPAGGEARELPLNITL